MKLYRIHKKGKISYSESEDTCIDYSKAKKENKKVLVSFIRSIYFNCNIRLIIKGVYKAIYQDGNLIGVQFDMNYIKG